MKNTTNVRLHRFQKYLALSLDSGDTEYLDTEQVKVLITQLNNYIKDVENNPKFFNSEFKTVLIASEGKAE